MFELSSISSNQSIKTMIVFIIRTIDIRLFPSSHEAIMSRKRLNYILCSVIPSFTKIIKILYLFITYTVKT